MCAERQKSKADMKAGQVHSWMRARAVGTEAASARLESADRQQQNT